MWSSLQFYFLVLFQLSQLMLGHEGAKNADDTSWDREGSS